MFGKIRIYSTESKAKISVTQGIAALRAALDSASFSPSGAFLSDGFFL